MREKLKNGGASEEELKKTIEERDSYKKELESKSKEWERRIEDSDKKNQDLEDRLKAL